MGGDRAPRIREDATGIKSRGLPPTEALEGVRG